MDNEQKQKEMVERALVFETSELWDSIHYILDAAIKAELASAISQGIEEDKRAHQCGRAESLTYFKDLLTETRNIARVNAGRNP